MYNTTLSSPNEPANTEWNNEGPCTSVMLQAPSVMRTHACIKGIPKIVTGGFCFEVCPRIKTDSFGFVRTPVESFSANMADAPKKELFLARRHAIQWSLVSKHRLLDKLGQDDPHGSMEHWKGSWPSRSPKSLTLNWSVIAVPFSSSQGIFCTH